MQSAGLTVSFSARRWPSREQSRDWRRPRHGRDALDFSSEWAYLTDDRGTIGTGCSMGMPRSISTVAPPPRVRHEHLVANGAARADGSGPVPTGPTSTWASSARH